ncbi:MAG: ferritin-like domain-containing protein [Leptolyngbyaceae cyanobacterium MAG.088]|nr:ferritin-like domain-containing protein [Leptolyngbyaceae cyanobacterium MAG.088]
MAFLPTCPNPWRPTDFNLSRTKEYSIEPDIAHIVKTTSLLESRADQYSDYLRAVFKGRDRTWMSAIDQWNSEEHQHGVVLRRLCEALPSDYDFESFMAEYTENVPYHDVDGQSVRGSVAAELVARCFVEASASTFYRVLADATTDKTHRAVFITLSKDEARHFGMFETMLAAEETQHQQLSLWQKIKAVSSRLFELEDAQIMGASAIVAGRSLAKKLVLRGESNRYLGYLYRHYRWKHVVYLVRLLLKTIGVKRSNVLVKCLSALFFMALKLRWLLATIANRLTFNFARDMIAHEA